MADAQRLSPTRVTFNIPIETQQEPADPRLLGMSHQPASRSPLLYNLEAKKRCINSELYTILRRDGLSGVNPADSAQLQDLLERIVPQTNEARFVSRCSSDSRVFTTLQPTGATMPRVPW